MNYENKIKLNAFTNDDLKILSYLCQDAILSNEEFFFDKDQELFDKLSNLGANIRRSF